MKSLSTVYAELLKSYLHLIEAGFDSSGNVNKLMFRGQQISGVPSYTWAQFIDAGFDLTTARYVRITDKHSSRNNEGGSIWYVDPTATNKRILISDPIYVSTRANALSAVTYPGLRQFIADEGAAGIDYISNGTDHVPVGGTAILRRGGAQGVISIQPAATFTSATPSNNAGLTKLTSTGTHGLTNAIGAGASIYVSAGTGWTVGWHQISSVNEAGGGLDFTLTTGYSAGFGTPTISLIGTELLLDSISVPPLTANSELIIDPTIGCTNSAATKLFKVQLGTTTFYSPTLSTSDLLRPSSVIIRNRNSKTMQVGASSTGNAAQTGAGTSPAATGTVDTSTATTIRLTCQPSAANTRVWLEGVSVIWRA